MKNVWTIARREVKSLFDQPTGYVLLIIFVVFNDFLFFRSAYMFRVASLRPMLELLPVVFLFFVPAVTMRAFAEDVRTGTLEVVLAQPITEVQLLLGKYLGQLLFVWIALALTIPIPIGLSLGADLHTGVIIAQYAGAAFLAVGFTAIGVWTSSLTRYQMTALILGVAVMAVLVLVGFDLVLAGLPPVLNTIVARLGVLSHFQSIARGAIDLRDAVYFLTLAAIFLMLSYHALMRRKLSPRSEGARRLQVATVMVVVGLVIVNLFGRQIRGRLDLTPGGAYTLSGATRDILRNLDDILTIRLFASDELPPQVALIRRDIDDLLADYRGAGGGHVRLIVADPLDDEEAEQEARDLGIPPVQFNVMGESEFTARDGYLGIALQYADESETIPFVQRTDDLEYRLTSYVRGMTTEGKSTVGFYTAPGPPQAPPQAQPSYSNLRQSLQDLYDVRTVTLPADDQPAADIDVLVLLGSPPTVPEDQLDRIRAFLDRGGSLFVSADGMDITSQQEIGMPKQVGWNALLEAYGLSVQSDMVYDLMSHESAQIPTQFGRMFAPYQLWVRGLSTRAMSINADIDNVFMPWTSSIDTSGAASGLVTPLIVTSEGAGVDSMMALLAPRRQYRRDGLGIHVLAAAANPLAIDGFEGPRGRVVVMGSTNALTDRFAAPGNIAFAQNAVDWLAQDEALGSIRAKTRTPPGLVFSSEFLQNAVKHGNTIGVPILLVLAAMLRLFKRRQLRLIPYRRVTEEVPA